MLIVPELKTVFILVPRTGSGTLRRELQRVYPKSMLLYRHMEADGVPQGYDQWARIGFVRHPVARLYSLFRFMETFALSRSNTAGEQGGSHSPDAIRIRSQVQGKTFLQWLRTNEQPWTTPADLSGNGQWWPVLSKRNPAPENRRSQWSYLRPDLGTQVLKFENLRAHMGAWGLDPAFVQNETGCAKIFSAEETAEVKRFCEWDFKQECKLL